MLSKKEDQRIKKQILLLAATRNSYMQNQGRDCYELEKKICLLTARYILIKLLKVFWFAAALYAIPSLFRSVVCKFKK